MKKEFTFEVGKSYETQKGKIVTILERKGTNTPGYETVLGDDKKHRYDRSTTDADDGRVTGTNHDYSCPDNFKKPFVARITNPQKVVLNQQE